MYTQGIKTRLILLRNHLIILDLSRTLNFCFFQKYIFAKLNDRTIKNSTKAIPKT